MDRPLSGDKRTTAFVLGDYAFPILDRPLEPADVDVGRVCEWAEALYRRGDGFLDGELVWGLPPLPGVPWMEAILGCPVWVSPESQSLWAEPWLADWEDLDRVKPLPDNPWYQKLLELVRVLVAQAGGRYPVTQTVMRGPADLAVAMRGHAQLCLDLYDAPERVKSLAHFCAGIWIRTARAQFELIPPFDGGYPAPRLEVWAPGQVIRYEEDASVLFSLDFYREFFQPFDRQIAAAFEYSILHTHSVNCKLLSAVAEMPELSAVQVSLDPSGPSLEKMIPHLRQVQAAGKPLLITHELPDADAAQITLALSPCGLALERMISV